MIFAFLCHCCFIELSALLIPKSLERSLVISILKLNLSEKNVLNGDLISGKLCVCQVTSFLVEQTAALGSRREMMANLKILKQNLLVLGNLVGKVQVSCSITQTAACTTKQELTKLCCFWDCS